MPLEITIVAISIASWQIQPDVQPVIFLPKLCSRQACHSAMMNGVTHSCNITHDRCGDPAADDVFSIQRKYCKSHDPVCSKESCKSKADVTNTFEEVQFRDNKHGLHGACCICLLHTFKQRYPDDCLASDVVHESIRVCFVSVCNDNI
jgi:hypothetical protein